MKTSRLLLGIGLAAFAAAAMPAKAEVVFKWANDGDVRAMDPNTLDETVQNSFLGEIYEPLVRRNRNLEVEPGLAISYEQSGPTTWRFRLRPGVKWQDGAAFTADDVLFSYQRITSKTSQTSGNVSTVAAVRKIDDLTVEFDTKGPDPILPSEFTNFPMLPKHWMEANNSAAPVIIGQGENFALRNAMGTGAFKLASREADRKNVLVKNPAWWDKVEHNLDRVEFTVISSAATRVAALLSGEMDMIYSVPPQDIDRIRQAPGIKIIQGPELRTIYLGMDQARDELLFSNVKGKNPFKDLRVRQAFALAIDEEAIVSRVMRGQGRATWMMWGPGVNGYNAELDKRPKVDIAKAKALLAEAGYPNGFEVTLDCSNDRYIADEQICVALSAMYARIGVKVNVFARTKVKFFADIAYPDYKTSFYMLGWTPSTYDADNVIRDHIVSRSKKLSVGNATGYSSSRIDDLEEKIAAELDQKKRQGYIDQVTKILQDEVGYIPLHQQGITWAARDNIQLVQPADNRFPMRWVRKN
jgi:peptide/nickel transport system substrate-binding protein